jgi:hypothetical protein
MVENKVLSQYKNVVEKNWKSKTILIPYDDLTKRQLFEIAFHGCNTVQQRLIWVKLSADENQAGSTIILYNSTKKMFCKIQAAEEGVNITFYASTEEELGPLSDDLNNKCDVRKSSFKSMDDENKNQILKTVIVLRKIDEAINQVMTRDVTRKVYFSVGDARETAAVIPMLIEAEGYSLVQLALNKWMTYCQNLPQDQEFPTEQGKGMMKNFLQIKKWVIGQIKVKLEV